MGRTATVTADNKLSWPDFSFLMYEPTLNTAMIILDPRGFELNSHDASWIAQGAIRSAIKKQGGRTPIDPDEVIRQGNKIAATFFRKPPRNYVLLSSLSISEFPATRIRIRSCEISPLKRRPGQYDYPENMQFQVSNTPYEKHVDSTKYQLIKIKTTGQSIYQAADYALNALHLLRGLWTLFAQYGSFSMSFGSLKQKSVGVIHAGPLRTIHEPDGKLVGKLFWYELGYTGDQKLFRPKNGWKKLDTRRRWAARRIMFLPYRNDLEDLIIRFVSALDNTDLDVAFLQIWSLLEKLTDTSKHDEIVQRASRIFADRELATDMLRAMRSRRNQYVHAADAGEDREQSVHLIKRLVEPHFLCLIRNDFKIQSIQEYGEFLSMPTDLNALNKRLRMTERALRLRKKHEVSGQSAP